MLFLVRASLCGLFSFPMFTFTASESVEIVDHVTRYFSQDNQQTCDLFTFIFQAYKAFHPITPIETLPALKFMKYIAKVDPLAEL